jgi:hypothetical protein
MEDKNLVIQDNITNLNYDFQFDIYHLYYDYKSNISTIDEMLNNLKSHIIINNYKNIYIKCEKSKYLDILTHLSDIDCDIYRDISGVPKKFHNSNKR